MTNCVKILVDVLHLPKDSLMNVTLLLHLLEQQDSWLDRGELVQVCQVWVKVFVKQGADVLWSARITL